MAYLFLYLVWITCEPVSLLFIWMVINHVCAFCVCNGLSILTCEVRGVYSVYIY